MLSRLTPTWVKLAAFFPSWLLSWNKTTSPLPLPLKTKKTRPQKIPWVFESMSTFPLGLTGRFPFVVFSGGKKNPSRKQHHDLSGPFRSFQATDKTMLLIRAVHRDMAPKPWMITKKIRILGATFFQNAGGFCCNKPKREIWGFPKLKGDIPKKWWVFCWCLGSLTTCFFFFFWGGGGGIYGKKKTYPFLGHPWINDNCKE